MDEFEERIGAAYSARTVDELAQLTSDLSRPPQPVAATEPERRRHKRRQERSEKKQSNALGSWQARRDAQAKLLELARQYRGESWPDFVCKPGEAVFAKVTSTELIEDRRQPGRYEGRSSGVSIPLGLGVRYRTGGSRGRYVQGASVPIAIDVGRSTSRTNASSLEARSRPGSASSTRPSASATTPGVVWPSSRSRTVKSPWW